MSIGVLIDPTIRQIEPLELSEQGPMADNLKQALGVNSIKLGARLPGGGQIYLDPFAFLTSKDYFRHCQVPTALPGRGILLGGPTLSLPIVRRSVRFITRDQAFASETATEMGELSYDAWLQQIDAGVPGVSLMCQGTAWRLSRHTDFQYS